MEKTLKTSRVLIVLSTSHHKGVEEQPTTGGRGKGDGKGDVRLVSFQTAVCKKAPDVHVLKNVYAVPADTKHLT